MWLLLLQRRLLPILLLLYATTSAVAGSFRRRDHRSQLKSYETTMVQVSFPSLLHRRSLSTYELRAAQMGHPQEEVHHPSHVYVSFRALGVDFDLELYKNHVLYHPEYKEHGINSVGRVMWTRTRRDITNCHYFGRVRSQPNTRVIMSTCHGLRGYIEYQNDDNDGDDDTTTVYIRPATDDDDDDNNNKHDSSSVSPPPPRRTVLTEGHEHVHLASVPHIVYRANAANYDDHIYSCGVGRVPLTTTPSSSSSLSLSDVERALHKQQHHHYASDPSSSSASSSSAVAPPLPPSVIRATAPAHCASGDVVTRYSEHVAMNDALRFEQRQLLTEENTASLFNAASLYYLKSAEDNLCATVHLVLKAQYTVISGTDPWTISSTNNVVNSNSLLLNFRSYATNTAQKWIGAAVLNRPYDQATLVSGYVFENSVVGLAYTGGMCGSTSAAVVSGSTTTSQAFDAGTVAHEIGHNFGMCHDNDDRSGCVTLTAAQQEACAGGYLMSYFTSLSSPYSRFSICSNADLVDAMPSMATCLSATAPAFKWPEVSVCGNGFRDGNETCDCGGYADCSAAPKPFTDPCCGDQCQLKANRSCSNLQPCCANCAVGGAGRVCRANADDVFHSAKCDIEEVCDGVSADCPADKYQDTCGDSFADRVAQWFRDNWQSLVVGGIFFLALIFLYYCTSACWDFCCGDGDDTGEDEAEEELKLARSTTMVGKLRGALKQQVRRKRKQRRARRRAAQRGGKIRAVDGIALPDGWGVRYTPEGVPVYLNHNTNERFDFRAGPPTDAQQQYAIEMASVMLNDDGRYTPRAVRSTPTLAPSSSSPLAPSHHTMNNGSSSNNNDSGSVYY